MNKFNFEMFERDIEVLQSAVENMRAAPADDLQRKRWMDARFGLAYELEQIAKRADVARRSSR